MEGDSDKTENYLLDSASSLQASIDCSQETDSNFGATVTAHPVVPRTIIGTASILNKGALDWGRHGLMAYAANSTVFVVDTKSTQIIQTLDFHKSAVKKLLWAPAIESKNDDSPLIQLISADASGHLVHWDISVPIALGVMQDGNKPVNGIEWVPGYESDLMLASLHSPYFLIIWDVKKQTKVWKKNFTDTLLSFCFDPFDKTKLAFLCPDCILFVDDFEIRKIPLTNGRKFYISNPDSSSEESLKGRDRLKKLMKGLVVGETKPKPDEAMTISECLQLSYHKSMRHHLLLLYPKDILLIDLHINQTIGIIPIERTMSPLIQVYTTRQKDILYCLHESGSISVKIRKKNNQAMPNYPADAAIESPKLDFGSYSSEMFVCYENKCQSEVVRQMKNSKVLGISVDPVSEKHVGLLLVSGKVIFLELEAAWSEEEQARTVSELIRPGFTDTSNLRLLSTGVLPNINGNITIIKMCPPRTKRNKDEYLPLLGVGTSTGYVYFYNLSIGTVYKEFALHNHPIRGLEWTDLSSVITYAYPDGRKVKNELFLTDICTGQSIPFRTDKTAENPINLLRVSPLSKYFVIAIVSGPFELWDLTTLTMLRTMTKKFPSVLALEWSPIYSSKSVQSKKENDPTGLSQVSKEHLVISDNESQLYHFAVNADGVKDGIKIPAVNSIPIISIAFKSNQLVRADVEGVLRIWDLKTRQANNIPINRGPIRYVRFAPGKYNMKLMALLSDGIEIVKVVDDKSVNKIQKVASLKLGRENSKIVDVDWANSEFPVIATEDGYIRVLDTYLTGSASHISDYKFRDEICSPVMFPPEVVKRMQFILCLQHWKTQPNYKNFNYLEGIPSNYIPKLDIFLSNLNIGSDFANLNITEKCLRLSKLLGDTYGVDMWTVALYYLRTYSAENQRENNNLLTDEIIDKKNNNKIVQPLDTCYDYLLDSRSYKLMQLERISLHEWKRGDYNYTQRVVEKLILLGETDRAVQLLLETDIDNPNYYTDAMKACLVATIQQTGAAQSTIKLVATNLIANGKVWEGVQLLCLIGKGLIGCRYLVSYGMWDSAVWLAKSILPPAETLEVMTKFSDYLQSKGDTFTAVLVQLSQGEFRQAIQLLYNQRRISQAFLLLMSCLHYGIPINKDLTVAVQKALVDNLKLIGYQEVEQELGGKLNLNFDETYLQ